MKAASCMRKILCFLSSFMSASLLIISHWVDIKCCDLKTVITLRPCKVALCFASCGHCEQNVAFMLDFFFIHVFFDNFVIFFPIPFLRAKIPESYIFGILYNLKQGSLQNPLTKFTLQLQSQICYSILKNNQYIFMNTDFNWCIISSSLHIC